MAPFVGLGSTTLVPSLLKALPALKASTISDSRKDIIAELCGVVFGEQELRDRSEGRVSDDFKVRFSHPYYTMQYDGYSIDEGPTWGVRSPRDGESDLGMVKDTMKKEQVIKSVLLYVFCFGFLSLSSREILASQEDLKGMHSLRILNLS
jgi:hypothetical protein